ncbi:MAG: long-chain acyl-CoA synthetase [Frankiales bacterium]|jgi:acyl-CoA synthetase (AMP-forming)/AMP-acid ligase II|nr:long-chain acyl-CoA synthetase [Frankiales bacterium]
MALVPDQLRHMAAAFPDEAAFTVLGDGPGAGDLTFAGWHGSAARLARGLVERGVQQGDRVALLTVPDDGLRFVMAYAATHMAGAVAVPVNIRLSGKELAGILNHAEPSAIVVSPTLADSLPDVPSVRTVVRTDNWDDYLAGDGSEFQVATEPDDLAEILYTSGTTGMPKGVAIRHSNSTLVVKTEPQWSGNAWIHSSPMFTFAGLTFVYQPMRMGMRTLYLPKFDVPTFIREVETRKPLVAFLVPAMVELLLAHPDFEKADMTSLAMVSVGSAPIAPTTLLQFQRRVPNAAVTNSYSMTEAGTAYCVLPQGELERRPGSVGKPLPPAEIRVVDEDGAELPPEGVGEIVIKPPHKPRFYYKNSEATAELFKGDWLHTGDLGKFDADGYLYVVGRIKDVIIRGGFNIYASDVESALYEHPDVQEAAVVGKPHPVLGEDIAAYVVLKDGATVTADELLVHCKEHLADYKVPRSLEFRSELPRNATGKVLKRALVEQ